MSLRTSLTPGQPAQALNSEEATPAPQGQTDSQTPSEAPATEQGGQNQTQPQQSIPYQRFQEVTHENQSLRQQVQEYQQRIQQVQQQQQAPSHGISGMQAPQQQNLSPEAQQQVAEFRSKLDDPKVAKDWQRRIATEGPNALYDFVEHALEERGGQMLQEALRPIVAELMNVRGDYVSNAVQQYASNVNDPEFPAYRHLFEEAVRNVAPNLGANLRNPQALDTIRYWAQAQYRAQHGQPQQQQQAGLQPNTFQPPVSERPGSPYGLPAQGSPNKFADVDSMLANKFGLSAEDIQKSRSNMVRGY